MIRDSGAPSALGRRLLQGAIAAGGCVPVLAGAAGVLQGAAFVGDGGVGPDLDSHFRYLSGIFLGVGLGFWSCIPAVERRGGSFRLLALFVILGGLARALSLVTIGAPGLPHLLGLGMELLVVPLLVLWQGRVAKAWAR